MIRGIHHVAVHVHDLDRMIRFYGEAFGFEVVGEPFEWDNDAFIDKIVDVPDSAAKGAMLRAGNCYLEMFEFKAPRPDSAEPKNPLRQGLHPLLRRCHRHRLRVRAPQGTRHDLRSAGTH